MASDAYVERVNAAIDYIVAHIDQPLRLEDVADAACFSPFHFHRVFSAMVGETLGQFVKRLRLERALYLMAHDRTKSLTEIAFACGFSSSSDFSRSFKQRFGVPPSAFDIDVWRMAKREELFAIVGDIQGCARLEALPTATNPDGFHATIRQCAARTVAYIRVSDPFHGGVTEAAERLQQWAELRGIADGKWLGYMWEDPGIVALEHCRYDVALEISAFVDGSPDGEVGRFSFPPMRVAEITIRGDIALEQRALDWLFGAWLPSSGFVPDEQPCFEVWHGRPFAHGFEHFELNVQLPIRRA